MGLIAVAAYSYMSLVPIIQPPIMKLLTTKKERSIRMGRLVKFPNWKQSFLQSFIYHHCVSGTSDHSSIVRYADAW